MLVGDLAVVRGFCSAAWMTPSHGSSMGVAKAPYTRTFWVTVPEDDWVFALSVPVLPPHAAATASAATVIATTADRRHPAENMASPDTGT